MSVVTTWRRADELAAAVRAVAAGMVVLDPSIARRALAPGFRVTSDTYAPELRLTVREGEVMRLLALGLPNKAIALELGISEHTVKFHVGAMLSKLGARSRTEAVTIAARRGLLAL
jgi:DNA-binding NarL/FixJ family response regulator